MASNQRTVPLTAPQPDAIPETDDGCVVWHCRHLRTTDHPALTYGADSAETILPLFVFDPSFYTDGGLACDSRVRFLHESLSDLADQYEERGGALTLAHGDPISILDGFHDAGWDIVTTADPTGRYGLKRDNAVATRSDVTFVDADGLVRDQENSRENWSDRVEDWFTSDQCAWDETTVAIQHIETPVTIERIEDAYDVTPQKEHRPAGGTSAGRAVLAEFTEKLPSYPENISAPTDARTGTSQLSPYFRFGCVSVRQAYQTIDSDCRDSRAKQLFVSRLYWNRHYNQKLVDHSGWMDTAVNPVMEGFHADTHNPELVEAWKQGQTGYPMVDASMRCLAATGWLNFRMRAMCASVLCDLFQQPWKIGADWFYYHLLDADPAINYTQFQIQAGMDGTNMMRVYNPRKQVRENDPDGEFVSKWVPELAALPDTHLDQPEKTPVHVQEECGVSIGEDYPYPVVEYEAARERILTKFKTVRAAAKRALQNEEVARRVSMSQAGGGRSDTPAEDESQPAGTQTSLSSF